MQRLGSGFCVSHANINSADGVNLLNISLHRPKAVPQCYSYTPFYITLYLFRRLMVFCLDPEVRWTHLGRHQRILSELVYYISHVFHGDDAGQPWQHDPDRSSVLQRASQIAANEPSGRIYDGNTF